jgi:hypothetical protein
MPENRVWAFIDNTWTEFSRYGTGDLAIWVFAQGEWQQRLRSVAPAIPPYPWTGVVFKTIDESIGGTSIQDDNELKFTTISGAFYEIDIIVIYSNPTGGAAGGLKFGGYEDPGGGSQIRGGIALVGIARTTVLGVYGNSTTDGSLPGNFGTSTTKRIALIRGAHQGAGSDFKLSWSQSASGASGTPTIVHAGSFLRYRKVSP